MVAMFGASMPAPLAIPATVKPGPRPAPPCGRSRWSGCRWPRPRPPRRSGPAGHQGGDPRRRWASIGQRDADQPGGADQHLVGGRRPSPRPPARTSARHRPTPGAGGGVGVAAADHHGRRRPPVAARWSRLTWTGAAAARLEVKVAAVGTGAAVVGGHQGQVEGARRLDPGRPGRRPRTLRGVVMLTGRPRPWAGRWSRPGRGPGWRTGRPGRPPPSPGCRWRPAPPPSRCGGPPGR